MFETRQRLYPSLTVLLLLLHILLFCMFPAALRAEDFAPRDNEAPFLGTSAVELSRYTTLHAFEAEQVQPILAPYPLLLGLMAAERFAPDRMITVSLAAEAAAGEGEAVFKAGRRISADYLLPALIMEGSQAAAVALAEELGGNIVEKLNERAKQLGFDKTQFYLSPEEWPPSGEIPADSDNYPVYSSVRDVTRLIRYIQRNGSLNPYFEEEQFTYFRPEEKRLFMNPLALAWGLSLDRSFVRGAFASRYGAYASHIYLCQHQGMEIAIVHFGYDTPGSPEAFTHASLSAFIRRFDWVKEHFEQASLVYAGDATGENLRIAGRSIPLYYLQSAKYIRPKGELYLDGEPVFVPNEDIRLPIEAGTSLGSIHFTLKNTQVIRVQAGSMYDVHAGNLLIDKLISRYRAQKVLIHWIFALTILLILWAVARLLRRLHRRRSDRA